MTPQETKFKEQLGKAIRAFAASKSQLSKHIVDEFIEALRIKNERVGSFKYVDMKKHLSKHDYDALLKIMGIDPLKELDFPDCECSHGICVANIGHSCDPVACRG